MALFFFMMVFMDTTATIPTGSMWRALEVEELRPVRILGGFAYCFTITGLWGGAGWINSDEGGLGHGAVGLRGSGVVTRWVESSPSVGAWCIGPRKGQIHPWQASGH